MRNRAIKNLAKRIFAGIISLPMMAGGFILLVKQAKGDIFDLNKARWSIGFIPDIFWIMILFLIPIGLGIFLLIYTIKGHWPDN
jgi:hypothetical protein